MRGDTMSWCIWYLLFIVLITTYIHKRRLMQQLIHKHMMKKRFGKEVCKMNELMKKYIGIEVIIYTGFSSVSGTLKKIEDDWQRLIPAMEVR